MNYNKIMQEGLKKYSIENIEEKLELFERYKELIKEWNKKINLTSITDDNDIAIKHFIDSLSILKTDKIKENIKIIDIGTGAGFPGIPLKIVDKSLNITLLDSLRKRIDFLKLVSEELKLEKLEFIHGRAEDFGQNIEYREQFDISVSRAVANLATLSEYSLPFVKINGYFIALKGPKAIKEIESAKNAIKELGGKIEKVIDVDELTEELNHKIVIIKKIKNTPKKYPRKAGMPLKKPL